MLTEGVLMRERACEQPELEEPNPASACLNNTVNLRTVKLLRKTVIQ